MWTKLHWVKGPWPGRLALAARPRGGDWLEEEIVHWRQVGIDSILSFLTPEEETDLGLDGEAAAVRALGMKFMSFPIPDRDIPASEQDFANQIDELIHDLNAGKSVVVHCRQGIGRTGLVAACLLISAGVDPENAVSTLVEARGGDIPETQEQRRWINHYAASIVSARQLA